MCICMSSLIPPHRCWLWPNCVRPPCPRLPQWIFSEDTATQVKSCKLSVTPDLPEGVPWGPVSSYNWNGDFGYWFDEPGVRA